MYALTKWLYLLALIVWLGEIVFFSFVVAPSIFRALPTAVAGRAVGAIFPTYYRVGYVCGGVLLLASLVFLGGTASRLRWGVSTLLAAVMLAATLYAGTVIQPAAAALRPQLHQAGAPEAVQRQFDRRHRLAVQLNGVVLVCGVIISVVAARAWRP
ncbi:MAG: DUF4149 domain-containing protein [Candidatus Binatia bacterium]